ncbi:DUF885 domain-containing protein [Maribacter hydrothermalis]|uniref:DUF885 domain-containing protein n=1 Tax=Maribacter hydrothermalis TaxID=1836467 RepID=A0A1B7Z144_9FLAO|nr:DUF885 domain-containing protein [Maribacter hydrothermalis]APQ18096.1 hypothetical protein BTR34_12490 [Maribacter hydrothermalis]OBR36442.1 hypothetical protein A9200_08385 [Maribacter hydrothermalis]
MIRSLWLLLCIAVISSCKETTKKEQLNNTKPIAEVFTEFYEFKKNINPIEATKAGYSAYNDTIANYISDDYILHLKDRYTYFLEQLGTYDSTTVSATDYMSMRVMEWDCNVKLEGVMNPIVTVASPIYDLPSFELMPLFQIQSLHLYVAQLAGGTSVQPFKNIDDYNNWLKRLEDYLLFLDTAIEKMKVGMDKGVVLPKVLTQKMLPQVRSFIDIPLEENLFYQPILNFPDGLSDVDMDIIQSNYEDFIQKKLTPKYVELNRFLTEEYLPACRDTDGLLDLPNGKATYQYLIKLHTTTNMTADAIHELGLSEVARISKEMEAVKDEIGFQGDLKSFFNSLRNKEELMPFSKPEEVIESFNAINNRIALHIDSLFTLTPKAGFNVRRTEAFREASASAEYVPGSKDGSRAGIFYVPIPDVKAYNMVHDEALFLHEAIPGHHFQLSLQQENNNLPEFLHPESMGVFVEGWALYAESLGKELGVYTDPYQYFGMLSMEMHRAIRLVVDTGIHAKGWTREEAIQYSLENEAESEESIIAEVERYMATPGQALSYKIGQLKIRELRTKAEKALGNNFNIREFHSQILDSGSLPLVLLEEKINNWIVSQNNLSSKKPTSK